MIIKWQMLRLKEAAELLGVTTGTLRNWTNEGIITCSRSKTGQRIFSKDDIESSNRKVLKKKQKLFVTAGSALLNKKTTLEDKQNIYKPIYLTNIPDRNVSSLKTSVQDLTLDH